MNTTSSDDCNSSQVTAVVSKWVVDFLFNTICRRFKERSHDAFNDAISTYESHSQTAIFEGGSSQEKTLICAFLARVMQGKKLDVRFNDDDDVMPLMSAAKTWFHLKDAVEDQTLFEEINAHLIVQAVALCLEKGQRTQARGALRWFDEHVECPPKVAAKLSNIVAQMDTYHPYLTVFSFDGLLEVVQTFLDAYLAKNPTDFLANEAVKKIQCSGSTDATDGVATEDKSLLEKVDHARLQTKTEANLQVSKKLQVSLQWQSVNKLLATDLSTDADKQSAEALQDTTLADVEPKRKVRSAKSTSASGRRLFSSNCSQMDASPKPAATARDAKTAAAAPGNVRLSAEDKADPSGETAATAKRKLLSSKTNTWEEDAQKEPPSKKDLDTSVGSPRRRTHRKWTHELDLRLLQGVRTHGKGKWSRILQDYDFEGRTGVMLKDRWRILEKLHKVD
ncbi:telomeric repeat-binding factor 1 isoform X2 [Syngnathus acus]|uniref:telomeric repeat-binding factor 1 isoform X2 n=1 Tax=Syngnathus acus TaxID=161584 RepID=UPI001885EF99|nr:telomeric repeat-binding factor 1 isoform X2 [Syngnathus acus]